MILYDPRSTLKIDPNVAKGYIILLTGGTSLKREGDGNSDDLPFALLPPTRFTRASSEMTGIEALLTDRVYVADPNLAFGALTDGNVLDACFGVKDSSAGRSHAADENLILSMRTAKIALRNARGVSESIVMDAIQSYIRCLRIVLGYHECKQGVWFWLPCSGRHLRISAERALGHSFQHLKEAIEAST